MTGYLKCDICGKITQVKIEVGYCESFPIFIPCKNCGTMFHGKYTKDDDKIIAGANFINAKEIYNVTDLPNYICTITGDFISQKISDVNSAKDTITFPMWMDFKDEIGFKNMQKLFGMRLPFIKSISTFEQYEWSRIVDLWFNKKYDLLEKQLIDMFTDNNNYIIKNDKSSYLKGIRKLTTTIFYPLFTSEDYENFMVESGKFLKSISTSKLDNLKKFLKEVNDQGLFLSTERLLYDQLKYFIQYIPNLIPILSLSYLKKEDRDIILDTQFECGIFTTNFESLKFLYQDLFETNVKSLLFPIALNNLYYRGNYDNFKFNKVNNITAYQKLDSSVKKIEYLENNDIFSSPLFESFNRHLRNSIGHCSYSVDNLKQVISYNKGKNEISLSKVSYNCYELALGTFKLFFLVTFLHEAYYNFNKPNI